MLSDTDLLRSYLSTGSQSAFAELVQRHLGLVYSAALRRTGGRHHLAEEVSQTVFCQLARKARLLADHPTLEGWLYRATQYAAVDQVRAEARRGALHHSIETMTDDTSPGDPTVDWERIRPALDEAMDQLKERDRELMLLRFFKGLSFPEVGSQLKLSENAARMRTGRALEKLRRILLRRGVDSTAAALALALSTQAVAAAPAGLAAPLTSAALAAASASGIAGLATSLFMSKITLTAASAVVAAGLTAIAWTTFSGRDPHGLADLRREHARLQALARAGTSRSAPSPHAALPAASTALPALAQAIEQARLAPATQPGAPAAAGPAGHNGHRYRGAATPREAMLSFSWASDAGDVAQLAKLISFDGNGAERAAAILASLPEPLRSDYRTPEELYALFIAADALLAPPPGADVLEGYQVIELSPGRVGLRSPWAKRCRHVYTQTEQGWKYVLPEEAVEDLPVQILDSDVLSRLKGKKSG